MRESLSTEEGLETSLSEELKPGETIDIVIDAWLCEVSSAEGGREDAGGDATGQAPRGWLGG